MRRVFMYAVAILLWSFILTPLALRGIAALEPASDQAFHEQLIKAEAKSTGKAKALLGDLDNATSGQMWLCANFDEHACLLGKSYPEEAVALYLWFGDKPKFLEVMARHGTRMVQVLWYFVENRSKSNELRLVAGRIKDAWEKKGLHALKNQMTPEEQMWAILWIVINRIHDDEYKYLVRFVFEGGGAHETHQHFLRRLIAIVSDLLLDNVDDAIKRYVIGQKITADGFIWAGVDVVGLGLMSVGTASLLKGGKVMSAGAKTVTVSRTARQGMTMSKTLASRAFHVDKFRHLLHSGASVGKVTKIILWTVTIGGVGYTLMVNPGLIPDVVLWIAERLGISRYQLVLFGIAIALLLLVLLLFLLYEVFARLRFVGKAFILPARIVIYFVCLPFRLARQFKRSSAAEEKEVLVGDETI